MKSNKLTYIVVAVLACMMACGTMGLPNAYGVFYGPMSEALNAGRGAVTMHVSLRSLSLGLFSPFVARLIRRRVPLRVIILAGAVLIFAGGMTIAMANNTMLMNVAAPFYGIGMALASSMIVTMIIGNWFEKYRGTLTGIALSFSGVGSAVAAPILTACINRFGYRPTYIGFVIAITLMVLPGAFFCPLTPQEKGLEPYGHGEAAAETKKSSLDNLDLVFRPASAVFGLLLVLIILIVTLTSLNSHLPSVAVQAGFAASLGATLLSFSMIGNVASKFILGVMIDRFGVYKGTAVMLISTFTGLFLIRTSANEALLLLGGFLYGASFSLGSLGASMITRHIYGDAQYPGVYSYITMAVYVASAITVTLIGYMYDLTGSYNSTVVIWAGLALATLAVLIVIGKVAENQKTKE